MKIVQDLLADFLFVLAVKVIIQALCIVAKLITLAVVEEPPAARVCTACPRVHSKRTVTSIPAAGERITFFVTHTVIGLAVTISNRALRSKRCQKPGFLFASFAQPAVDALALEKREADFLCTQASIAAGLGGAALTAAVLTQWPAKSLNTGATCTS